MVRMAPLHLTLFTRNPKCTVFQGKSIQGSLLVIPQYEFENTMHMKLEDNTLISPLHAFKHNPSYSKLKLWGLFIFVLLSFTEKLCIITCSRPNWVLPYLIFVERSIRRVYLNQFSSAFYLNCGQSMSTNKCVKSQ